MAHIDDVSRAITIILSSISRSIDSASYTTFEYSEDDDRRRSVVLLLAGIRDRIRAFRVPRVSGREVTPGEYDRYQQEVKTSLRIIRSNKDFDALLSRTPFKFTTFSRTDENLRILEGYFDREMDVSDAFNLIEELLAEAYLSPTLFDDNSSSELERLKRIVPDQKIAPIQFEFVDGRLVILNKRNSFDRSDAYNIDSAKEALISSGEKIINDLANSNVDKRLLENIEEINEQLRRSDNIIQLGLSNIACGMVCNSLRDVLSDTLNATVSSYVLGIDMYVSQFPDWGKFVEQAAAVRLEEEDVVSLQEATASIVDELEARPDIVDPEVPRAFTKLLGLLSDPSRASKKAAFAVLRTIGNLVSKVLSFSSSLLQKTASKVIDGLSTAAAGVIVFGLLTLAVNSAQGVSAVASKINEMNWLRTAIEIVQSQINKLKQ